MYAPGTVLAGKYRVEHVLGEGGMGLVVAATHMVLGTQVALKFLREDMSRHPAVVERFLREARASAQLRSDHVCRVSDIGQLENGVPYLVMELLHGRDLSSMLKGTGPMPPQIIADYVLQACQALAEAHSVGIVHRDVKPANLFLTRRTDGNVLIKVLDFGVAKAPQQQDFSLTQTSTVMGSPGYMSPEQLKSSKEVDARSDIWSLGVVMYELVTGRQPFLAQTITELALRVAMDPTPPLPPNAPKSFVDVVARCMEKDPLRRYQDVAQLAAALAPLAGPQGAEAAAGVSRVLYGTSTPIHMPPMQPATPTTLRGASGVVEGGAAKRSWKLPAVIGFGAAAGIVAVVVAMGGGAKTNDEKLDTTAPASKPADTLATPPTTPDVTKSDTPAATTTPPTAPAAGSAAKPDTAMTSDTPKSDTAKSDATTDGAKTDAVKTDAVKADTAKSDAAKTDTAKTDAAKTDTAKTDTAKTDAVKTDAVKTDAVKTDAVKTDTAKTDAAKKTDAKKKRTKKTTVEDVGDSRF